MKIKFLGTGAWLADAKEHCFGASIFVERKESLGDGDKTEKILLEAPAGINYVLAKQGIDSRELDTIWISHLHPDHVHGLLVLIGDMHLRKRTKKLRIMGPSGIEEYFKKSKEMYSDFLSIEKISRFVIEVIEIEEDGEMSDMMFAQTLHGIPSYAIAIFEDEKKLVYSGDTALCDSLIEICEDADLAILECTHFKKMEWKHLYPEDIERIKKEAEPKMVRLVHMFPFFEKYPEDAARDSEELEI